MVYSYIGLSKPITAFNNLMLQKQTAYRRANPGLLPQLEPGGIYGSGNSEVAPLLAADSDMCVYRDLEPLLRKSDIIFLFLPDDTLKNISLKLGKYPVKGKIFCHFSSAYDASIIDFNSANTYLSMHPPYFVKDDGRLYAKHIVAEGYGRSLHRIKDAFSAMDMPLSIVSKEEKLMYHTAGQISKLMPLMLQYASQRLARYALASYEDLADDIFNTIAENPSVFNTYDPIEADDISYVQKQIEVLKSIGLNELTYLVGALELMAVKTSDKKENTDRMINYLERNMGK